MVQDLGLSSPVKRRPGKLWSAAECTIFNRAKGSLVEKRAFLGTYFLTAVWVESDVYVNWQVLMIVTDSTMHGERQPRCPTPVSCRSAAPPSKGLQYQVIFLSTP